MPAAVIELHGNVRCRAEFQRTARDNGTAAVHAVVDVQRTAVDCFQHAIVVDDGAGIERKRATGNVSFDRAMRLIDQGQIAVASSDLADAGDGIVDVGQDVAEAGANDQFSVAVEQ